MTINHGSTQNDPSADSSIEFDVVFSESVSGFTDADVTLSGTAGATTATVTGSGTTYSVAVTGMTSAGTVVASLPAGGAQDAAGNTSASSTSTDHTVTWEPPSPPSVSLTSASGQPDQRLADSGDGHLRREP